MSTKKNEREIETTFREYALRRLEEKAKEKEIEINQDQREAVGRLTVTTSIIEAARKYQNQRVEIGQPATAQQIMTAVIIAALSEAAYFHSDDRKIPINKFSPIIYLNPVSINIFSLIDKKEAGATMVHEIEHAVDDILGLRWIREVNEETKDVLGLLKSAISSTEVEKSARAQEQKLR